MTDANTSTACDQCSTLTQDHLRQFSGGLERFRHGLNPSIIYTAGVQYLAEQANAYWLVDAVASYFGTEHMERSMDNDSRIKSIQFWRLDVTDETGVLTARADNGVAPFVHQQIAFTDFPLDYVDIWAGFDGRNWTLYLPSEH